MRPLSWILIIYATGFDALTGELFKIDIRGEGGLELRDHWAEGARSHMTLMTAGFPNFFITCGAVFSNVPRSSEVAVEFVGGCVKHMREKGFTRIATTREAEDAWLAHNNELLDGQLLVEESAESWFLGSNIPGKKRHFIHYAGGSSGLREKCEEAAANGWADFQLS